MAFEGVNSELFAAYTPEKWSSNAHNLGRIRGKDTLTRLADALVPTVGAHFDDLQRGASDEFPTILNQKKVDTQWIYWTRSPDEKKTLSSLYEKLQLDSSALMSTATHDKHALVGLAVDQNELWVTFRIAPAAQVDCRNLGAKLRKDNYRAPFLELLGELPQGFHVGMDGARVSAAEFEDVEGLSTALNNRAGVFAIRRAWSADEATALGAKIITPLAASLEALDPLYRFCAWSRENDHTEVGKMLQQVEVQKQAKALAFAPGEQVRVIGGMFKGKRGLVESIDAKAKVKVRVGTMSVMISGRDLTSL